MHGGTHHYAAGSLLVITANYLLDTSGMDPWVTRSRALLRQQLSR